MPALLPSSVTERFKRCTTHREGQSAVETMLLVFGVMVVLMAMVHLWQVTWAAQNANLRAREVLLHGDTYLDPGRAAYVTYNPSEIPFDPAAGTYKKANPGAASFRAGAFDATQDDIIGSQSLEVELRIQAP
ncbi:MAG: hypothetical protein VX899_05610 [Myxococcota bacterium]|nr:hypothetical protein [Myxococcota bacterium]